MNFDKYKPTLPYPVQTHVRYIYEKGKCTHKLYTEEEYRTYVDEWRAKNNTRIGSPTNERVETNVTKYKKLKREYEAEERRLMEQFQTDLYEEFGVTDNPKRELLYSKAWDEGHYAGLSEVYCVFRNMVDLIQ